MSSAKLKNIKMHPTLPFPFVICPHSDKAGDLWPTEVYISQFTGCSRSETKAKAEATAWPHLLLLGLQWCYQALRLFSEREHNHGLPRKKRETNEQS